MPTINLTLSELMIPAINGYTQPFGTKVDSGINEGGLTTLQVNNNMLMAFSKMRPIPISTSSDTTVVQYDAKLSFISSVVSTATLTLNKGDYDGCSVIIMNVSAVDQNVNCMRNEGLTTDNFTIEPNSEIKLIWNGTQWVNIVTKVSTTAPNNPTAGDIWIANA